MNIKTSLNKVMNWFDQLAIAFDQSSSDAILQRQIDDLQKQIDNLKNEHDEERQ